MEPRSTCWELVSYDLKGISNNTSLSHPPFGILEGTDPR